MRPLAAALCTLLCLVPVARAHDPRSTWQTLTTPHFRLHYADPLEAQAQRMADAAEAAHDALVPRLGELPEGGVDIVVSDEMDAANGFARRAPYSLMDLNAAAPEDLSELSDYRDWAFTLVAHELTHVVHFNSIGGAAAWIDAVFGPVIVPNSIQPTWFVEGLAVYFESILTGRGRVRSTYFDTLLRTAVLDDLAMDLGVISGAPWAFPQGGVPYLYGGRFLDHIARTHGEASVRALVHDYGSRLVPFALNLSALQSTGADYDTHYARFLEELRERYEAQRERVVAAGVRQGEPLTTRGQGVGPARARPDGSLVYVEAPIDDHAAL
ncbi:MAG TPA: hypothetical protein VFH51_17030, partial [Myxococcota bacterium]|nr:hypothetical protein [Myxococcota bacterium]